MSKRERVAILEELLNNVSRVKAELDTIIRISVKEPDIMDSLIRALCACAKAVALREALDELA